MDDHHAPGLDSHSPTEPATSVAVRRFLSAQGIKEHNHASEIARIILVDRSQSYRRLKGDVAWSPQDLRQIAKHFGATEDQLRPSDDATRPPGLPGAHGAPDGVLATVRIPHLPATGLLVPGAELGADDSTDLVAVHQPAGWEVWLGGEEPAGVPRHAVEALTLRSQPHLQVALLEDDVRAAAALVEAFRPLGIAAASFAGREPLLAALPRRRYDAFILDWLLPDGNAAAVVEQIRQHRPHVPIVVVTGALVADADAERTLLQLSAQWNFSTLDKPVRPMNLANTVKQLVSVARRG
jgi:CheY-like chemotaxis protein